jgi:hypothetical protein
MFVDLAPPADPRMLRAGLDVTHKLKPGQRLTVVADAHSRGHILQIETNPGEHRPNTRTEVPAGASVVIGPFADGSQPCFRVLCDVGHLIVTAR